MKKILVIGGTGFIGYHVIKEAIKRKWKVTSISLHKPTKKKIQLNVKYKIVNTNNLKLLKKKLNGNFDYVVNAGGYGNHPDFGKKGQALFDSHFIGLINLVKILSKKKIKKFIQIGSSAEYGNANAPQKETYICNPNTPYGLAKFSCSNLLLNTFKANKFPAVILRFFLVYGPDQDLNRLLPQVIVNSFKNKKFPTTKGDQYCDFCFVDDVVEAIFKALNIRNTSGKIFNIGSGKPLQIKKVIKQIVKTIGSGKPLFGKIKYKKNTNMRLYPNITKAKKILKWKPKLNFVKGLNLTINSYR